MYGMVNSAVRKMLISNHGVDCWNRVRAQAGLDHTHFESMMQYDDDVTYRLVAAASKELDAPADEVLEAFGRYWISFARESGYESLLSADSDGLFEFIEGLDDMHSRLALSFADYRPPSFHCSHRNGASVRLHYVSDRAGLASFVIGLLHGLGELFGDPVTVTHLEKKADGSDHDVFELSRIAPA